MLAICSPMLEGDCGDVCVTFDCISTRPPKTLQRSVILPLTSRSIPST